MVTCRDTIQTALQMARVVALGEEPSASELDAGMTALQGMFERWIAAGMFGRLTDRYETTDVEADERDRLWVSDGTGETVPAMTLPTTVDDRKPRDLTIIERFNGNRSVSLWDRDQWVELLDLTPESLTPLAGRGRTGIAACLAMEFVEMFGGDTITASVARMAASFRVSLATKLGTTQDASEAAYF